MSDLSRHASVDQANLRTIVEVVRGVDVTRTDAWAALDILSSQTIVDSIEVIGSVVKVSGQSFEGVVNLHCTLRYNEGEDHFILSESFPGRFTGRITEQGATLESLSVDTSGFLR